MSDNDTNWGFETEWYGDFVDGRETVTIDPDATSLMNLESAAMRWGYSVSFILVGPYRSGLELYVVEGRDDFDFATRWSEATS